MTQMRDCMHRAQLSVQRGEKERKKIDARSCPSRTDARTNLLGVVGSQLVVELHPEANAPQRQRRQQFVDARGSEGEGHLSNPRLKSKRPEG